MAIELALTDHAANPAQEQATTNEPATAYIESMHPRMHTADALSAEELERHLVALSQHRLQGLAQRVAAARSRLLDLTAAAEALSLAVDAALYTGCDPEHWLQNDLAEVLAQIEQAEAGRKRADARRVARAERVTPLMSVVGKMHTPLVHERETLWNRRRLLSDPFVGREASPYQRQIDAGLSHEQTALIGATQAPDAARQKDRDWIRDRLAETEPQIAAIEHWYSSGYRDHHHLTALRSDPRIAAAQPVGEEVAQ